MLSLLTLIVLGGLGLHLYRIRQHLDRTEQQVLSAAVLQHEWALQQRSQQHLMALQGNAEAGIEGTTRVVQRIHQGIAAIPFEVLEAIPATRDTARLVRGVHDLTSAGVYGSISAVNKGVGRGLRRLARDNSEQDR